MELSAARFPRLSAYLASLPKEWDSYPDCVVKAATYRQMLDALAPPLRADELPEPIVDYVAHPRPVSSYVPEVHNIALYLAVRDLRFKTDAAWLDWIEGIFDAFYASPLYRVLFFVATPSMLLKGGAKRWAQFRKGTKLERASELESDKHLSRLVYPPQLFPKPVCEAFARGIRAAVRASGLKHADVIVKEHGPTSALLHIQY